MGIKTYFADTILTEENQVVPGQESSPDEMRNVLALTHCAQQKLHNKECKINFYFFSP